MNDKLRSAYYWSFMVGISSLQIYFSIKFFNHITFLDLLKDEWIKRALPFFILTLSSLIPAKIKEIIAFFRAVDPLPGCRAFENLSDDSRIDEERLLAKIGNKIPDVGPAQNKLWYSLYQKVKDSPEILSAHKSYLLFRDLASLQFLFCILWTAAFISFNQLDLWGLLLFNWVAYLIFIICTHNNGKRFVHNVLAIISHQ